MNDLSNGVVTEIHGRRGLEPIPSRVIFALVPLFLVGLSVSIFILVVVRNASFFVAFALLSSLVVSFILWNTRSFATKASLVCFVSSLPETDLSQAKHGQLVKITGYASCGTVSLESSYERANRCVYTSTLLYERPGSALKPWPCFQWSLAHCERFCTDFYISDEKSGLGAIVKAGHGCTVVPLVPENELVNTSTQCTVLSPAFHKWLRERNLSDRPRLLHLHEGYIKEGSTVSVVGMLSRDNETMEIVQPPEVLSTGCLWKRLLLPVDIDGLVICISQTSGHSKLCPTNTLMTD